MTLIVPPGFGNAAFIFTGAAGTQPFVTTLGVTLNLGERTAVECANDLMQSYAGAFAAQTTSILTLDRVQLYVGDDGPSGSVDSDIAPLSMSRSTTPPPIACSTIVRKVTSDVGRRGRGRMFAPGLLSEAEIDPDGSVVPARRTTLTDAFTAWFDDLVNPAGLNLPPVLLHSLAPVDPTPLTGFAISDLVGWIRGRIR